jgi:two-component system response regulator HupR/HoxA
LADFISRKYADSIGQKILGIANEVHQRLQAYDWPGNVRELENEMKRMVSLTGRGEFLTLSSLSEHLISISPRPSEELKADGTVVLKGNTLREKVESVERTLVGEALNLFRWNQTRAAESLGLSRVGLANKIKRYGLDDPDHIIEN